MSGTRQSKVVRIEKYSDIKIKAKHETINSISRVKNRFQNEVVLKQRTLIISCFLAITLCLSDIYRRKSNRNPVGIGDIPIIGGVLNTGELLIDSIYGGSKTVIAALAKEQC